MHAIYQNQKINIEWSVFKGLSREKESFVGAKLNVFLTQICQGDNIGDKIHLVDEDVADGAYHLGYITTTNEGVINIKIDNNLPVGMYGIKAIWSKNHGRSISCSEKQYLFSVTNNQEEANEIEKSTVVMKINTTTATYGLDGMSAYETAVMHDLTTYLTEKEWVQVRASEIETNQIKDGAITTLKIADKAVSTDKIKDLNVTEAKIKDGAVTTAKIKDNAVITDKIATGNVTTSKIADKAVTEAKIHDGNVTTPKIADDAVTTNKIGDGQVSELKLAPGAVISSKIADKAVKEQHIDDGAVQERHIDEKAVTTDKIGTGQITTDKIDDYAVKSEHIKPGAVGTMEIANGAVESQHLATEIKDDEGNVVQKAAVQNENIAAGAVTEGTIGTGQVTNSKLAPGAITTEKLANGSLLTYVKEVDDWRQNTPLMDDRTDSIEIPIPRQCAVVNLRMNEYGSALPTQKKDSVEDEYQKNADGTFKLDGNGKKILAEYGNNKVMKYAMLEYWDKDGNHFTRPVWMAMQGNSTVQYKLKNYAVELYCGYCKYADAVGEYPITSEQKYMMWRGKQAWMPATASSGLQVTEKIPFNIKFGNWVSQNAFHFKKFYQDVFVGESIVGYNLAEEVYQKTDSRPSRNWLDRSGVTGDNGDGSVAVDLRNDALCHPDGFPFELYVDGEYAGLYVWQLKKAAENYGFDEEDGDKIILEADEGKNQMGAGYNRAAENGEIRERSGFWNVRREEINWKAFAIKSPKKIGYNGGTSKIIDTDENEYSSDSPCELYESSDYGTKVYRNKAFEGKKTNDTSVLKSIIEYVALSPYRIAGTLGNSPTDADINTAKAEFEKIFDVPAMISYYVVSQIVYNFDGFQKNWIWTITRKKNPNLANSYDIKAAPNFYDMDSIFGRIWRGTNVFPESHDSLVGNAGADPKTPKYSRVLPTSLLQTLFSKEIDEHYAELRRTGVYSVDNIIRHLKEWIDRCGKDALERNIELVGKNYKGVADAIPSYRASNINTEYWEIVTSGTDGLAEWDADTVYDVDDDDNNKINVCVSRSTIERYVGKAITDDEYNSWKVPYGVTVRCIKTYSNGKTPNPLSGAEYGSLPFIGGMYDGVERVRQWLTQRFVMLDGLFGYEANPITDEEIRISALEDTIGKTNISYKKTIPVQEGKSISGKKEGSTEVNIKGGTKFTVKVTGEDGLIANEGLNIGFVRSTDPEGTSADGNNGTLCIHKASLNIPYNNLVYDDDIVAIQVRTAYGNLPTSDGNIYVEVTGEFTSGLRSDIKALSKKIDEATADAVREHDGIKYGYDHTVTLNRNLTKGMSLSSKNPAPSEVYISKDKTFEVSISGTEGSVNGKLVQLYICKNGDEGDWGNKKENKWQFSIGETRTLTAPYDISRINIGVGRGEDVLKNGSLKAEITYFEEGVLGQIEDLKQYVDAKIDGLNLDESASDIVREATKGNRLTSKDGAITISIPKGEKFDVYLDVVSKENGVSNADAIAQSEAVALYAWKADGTKTNIGRYLNPFGTVSFTAPFDIVKLSIGLDDGAKVYANCTITAKISGQTNGITDTSGQSAVKKYEEQIDRAKQFGKALSSDTLKDWIKVDDEYLSQSRNSITSTSGKYFIPHLAFMHISDTHEDDSYTGPMSNAVEVLNKLKGYGVKFMLHTGDVSRENLNTSDISDYNKAITAAGTTPVLQVVGNHDAYNLPSTTIYNKLIKPNVSKWGVTQPTGAESGGKCYYFKDFDNEKVRLIVLYDFDGDNASGSQPTGSTDGKIRGYKAYSQEQIRWFCETLSSTPEGYGVIVAGHMPRAHRGRTDNGFNTRPLQGALYEQNRMVHAATVADKFNANSTYYDFIPAIVQKFIEGGVCDATMDAKMIDYNNNSIYHDVKLTKSNGERFSFAGDNKNSGVEFICYCDGHTHADGVNFLRDYPQQLELNIGCDNTHYQHYSDTLNEAGTKTEDLMNVYAIDRNEKKVYIQRIGNSTSGMGKDRDHLVIDYRGLSKNPGMIPSTEDNE